MKAYFIEFLTFVMSFVAVYLIGLFLIGQEYDLVALSHYTAEIATAFVVIIGLQTILLLNGNAPWVTISIAVMLCANIMFDLGGYSTELIGIIFDMATMSVLVAFHTIGVKCSKSHHRRWTDGRKDE